jgi:hypothetical protein
VFVLAACLSSGAGAIIGGTTIQVQAAPWTVFVQQTAGSTRFLCTGSVVDASHILTAAHCLYDGNNNLAAPSAFLVRAGISNFSSPLPSDLEQDRAVSQFRVHPGYTSTGQANPDDVAVLALVSPLDLSGPAVKAVALPAANTPFPGGATVTIAGFGKQSPTAASSGPLASLTGNVDPQGVCGGSNGGFIDFNAIELCEASSSSAVCNGDSGGGLVTGGSTPTLIGVVSAGAPGCDVGSHSLFTYTGAPEILAFIQGSDQPPAAPREGANGVDVRWFGPLVVGNTLDCEPGDWPNTNATYAYSFVNTTGGAVLQHGPASKFTIPVADKGAAISCEVAATSAGGTSLDETTPTSPIKGPPQARIAHLSPVPGAPGGSIQLRVMLVTPAGLFGKFSVCITPPKSVAGRLCRSTTNADGGAESVPFIFKFRVKPTAKAATDKLAITAVAGLSSATSAALLRIS